jgi:chromosome segregation ATPase
MTVGSIQTTANPPLTSGIYEALLEKAERERDEARKEKEKWGLYAERVERERDNLEDQRDFAMDEMKRLERERNYYKESIEEISTTIQDWLDSIVQEPSLDFIKAIKTWADKKLNNG